MITAKELIETTVRLDTYFDSKISPEAQAFELRQLGLQMALEHLADTYIGDQLFSLFELADAIDGKNFLNLIQKKD